VTGSWLVFSVSDDLGVGFGGAGFAVCAGSAAVEKVRAVARVAVSEAAEAEWRKGNLSSSRAFCAE